MSHAHDHDDLDPASDDRRVSIAIWSIRLSYGSLIRPPLVAGRSLFLAVLRWSLQSLQPS